MRARVLIIACVGLPCVVFGGGCSGPSGIPTRVRALLPIYELVHAWGDSGRGNGQFDHPQGVAADGDGNVYIVDTWNLRIQKFTGTADYLTQWGSAGSGNGQFGYVSRAAVDGDGNVYVADPQHYRIQKFAGDGTYLTQWGSPGTGDGQFRPGESISVAVSAGGEVYVADPGNHRIQKFSSDGAFTTQWGAIGPWEGRFFRPSDVGVDGAGNVYLMDGATSVGVFTNTGGFIRRWSIRSPSRSGAERLAVDARGNVLVTDRGCLCLKRFTAEGAFHTQWAIGTGRWLWTPGLAVDRSGNVYVTDPDRHRVLKYAIR